MRLGELTPGTDVTIASAPAGASPEIGVRICDVTEDSRTVLPGSLFVARPGHLADGRKYIADALRGGAAAILTDASITPESLGGFADEVALLHSRDVALAAAQIAERFFGAPSSALGVVGITGTNGKTTVSHLLHRLLNASGVRAGMVGTVQVDDGAELAEASMTTPPAIELSQTLATMVESGCRAAVLEVSSHALDQKRVGAIDFDAAIFTNLSGDHLDYHGTMDAYAAAKATLFTGLRPDATAIVNADDGASERMLAACRSRILRCSAQGGADCTVAYRTDVGFGMRVELSGPWGPIESRVPLVGAHNAMNLLQAVAAAHALGVDTDQLRRAVSLVDLPRGRLEPVGEPGPDRPFAVLVDFAHTDDALERALTGVRPLVGPGGRLRVVFGCGGDRDRTKRPRMGAVAAKLADEMVITSDNPRTEAPSSIIDAILSGLPAAARGRARVESDRETAIRKTIDAACEGDVVLIAGKGHETYQLLPDGKGGVVRREFDDRQVARRALADRRRERQEGAETREGVGAS